MVVIKKGDFGHEIWGIPHIREKMWSKKGEKCCVFWANPHIRGKCCVILTNLWTSTFCQFWSQIFPLFAYKGKTPVIFWGFLSTFSPLFAYKGKIVTKSAMSIFPDSCHVFRPILHIREKSGPFLVDLCAVFRPLLHIR